MTRWGLVKKNNKKNNSNNGLSDNTAEIKYGRKLFSNFKTSWTSPIFPHRRSSRTQITNIVSRSSRPFSFLDLRWLYLWKLANERIRLSGMRPFAMVMKCCPLEHGLTDVSLLAKAALFALVEHLIRISGCNGSRTDLYTYLVAHPQYSPHCLSSSLILTGDLIHDNVSTTIDASERDVSSFTAGCVLSVGCFILTILKSF